MPLSLSPILSFTPDLFLILACCSFNHKVLSCLFLYSLDPRPPATPLVYGTVVVSISLKGTWLPVASRLLILVLLPLPLPSDLLPHPFCKASSSTGTEQSTPVSDSSTSTAPCDFGSPRPPPSISDTFRNHLLILFCSLVVLSKTSLSPLSCVLELLRHFAANPNSKTTSTTALAQQVRPFHPSNRHCTALQRSAHPTQSHLISVAKIPQPKFQPASQPIVGSLSLSLLPERHQPPLRVFFAQTIASFLPTESPSIANRKKQTLPSSSSLRSLYTNAFLLIDDLDSPQLSP